MKETVVKNTYLAVDLEEEAGESLPASSFTEN